VTVSIVACSLLSWTTSSATAADSCHVYSLSPLVGSDQVQGVWYSEPKVETDVAALELETLTATLELETSAAALELEMDTAALELEMNTTALKLEIDTATLEFKSSCVCL
jgi:uridylate kinase